MARNSASNLFDIKVDPLAMAIPMFSGSKDTFGREVVPPIPLSFDRVTGGKPLTSKFPVFTLPVELISQVAQYFSVRDLASLALVDSDCRQLARSVQFRVVRLDLGHSSVSLIKHISQESRNQTIRGIGCCVRRLIVASDSTWVNALLERDLVDGWDGIDKKEKNRRIKAARNDMVVYYNDIALCLREAFTNLEFLDWKDKVYLSQKLLHCISLSPIRHLKLDLVEIDHVFEMPGPDGSQKWSLQTLDLEIRWSLLDNRAGGSVVPLCLSIIRQASPTLCSLKWQLFIHDVDNAHMPNMIFPAFPQLRRISFRKVPVNSHGLLQAILSPNTIVNYLFLTASEEVSSFLTERGTVPSLESFHWLDYGGQDNDGITSFLKSNPHLRAFTSTCAMSSRTLDKLLPLFSSEFKFLTTLALIWPEEVREIPVSCLRMIGQLSSLRKLWLSAGHQFGWRHDWVIDRKLMHEVFSPLIHLRHLAFDRNSYRLSEADDLATIQAYYHSQKFPLDVNIEDYIDYIDDNESDDVVSLTWERWHRTHVVEEATEYACKLPSLQWIYMGQLPMRIEDEGSRRVAVPESNERDDCYTLLRRMWDVEE